jgi:hypothetical protein
MSGCYLRVQPVATRATVVLHHDHHPRRPAVLAQRQTCGESRADNWWVLLLACVSTAVIGDPTTFPRWRSGHRKGDSVTMRQVQVRRVFPAPPKAK